MFCEECGAPVQNETSRFCEECGAPITTTAPAVTVPADTTAPPAEAVIASTISSEAPGRQISRSWVWIVAILVILAGGGYFLAQKYLYGPEAIALQYIEAAGAGKYAEAYSCLEVPPGDWTSEEYYIAAMEKLYGRSAWLESCTLTQLSGDKDKGYTFRAEYTLKDGKKSRTTQLKLLPQKEKLYGIFPAYRVVPEEPAVVPAWKISIPVDTELSLNGKSVDKKLITALDDSTSTYTIKNIWAGSYKVKMSDSYGLVYEESCPTEDPVEFFMGLFYPYDESGYDFSDTVTMSYGPYMDVNSPDFIYPEFGPTFVAWSDSSSSSQQEGNYSQCAWDSEFNNTYWCEGVKGPGIDQTLTLSADNQSVDVKTIYFENGNLSSPDAYYEYNRIKKMRVEFSLGEFAIVNLPDQMTSTGITFDDSFVTSSITFTILEVYPGSKYDDTCVSNIMVFSD